jgi:uncharacterized membrane protein
MNTDGLVDEYLGRLETAARGLPTDRRAELVAEVREHIEMALADAGSSDEATVRNVLERLGPPDEIVAEAAPTPEAGTGPDAATGPVGERSAAASAGQGWGATEIGALAALIGAWVALALAPLLTLWPSVILWLALGALGIALAALSDRWSRRRKQAVVGAFMGLYVLAALVVVTLMPVGSVGGPPPGVTGAPAPTVIEQTAP